MLKDIAKDIAHAADKLVGHDTPNTPDLDMQKVLDAQQALGPKPIETLTPEEARLQPSPADGAKVVMREKGLNPDDPQGVMTVDTHYMSDGFAQTVRLYWPEDRAADEILPVILYFHGGGFVIADIDVYDATPRTLAREVRALVVSAEYRHAPEHKFPAAHDDAYAAYLWTLDNAAEHRGDPERVALAGESAGGNLAIATAIKARDAGKPVPLHQLLVYPVAGTDLTTPSYQRYGDAKPLNKAMMEWFVGHYTNSKADLDDPRLDVIGKARLEGLPPTTLVLAEIDPLCSDGEKLAEALKAADVQVSQRVYEGATHEFFGMAPVVGEAKLAQLMAVERLRTAFGYSDISEMNVW